MRARQASLNPSNEGSDACYDQYPNKTLTLNLDDGGAPPLPRDLISLPFAESSYHPDWNRYTQPLYPLL